MTKIGCTIILILLFPIIAVSQSINFSNEAERYFSEAIQKYKSSDFDNSIEDLKKILKLPFNQRTTAAWIMTAKNYYQLKKFNESIEAAKVITAQYPQSEYVDDSYFTIGLAQYRMGDYVSSFYSLLNTILITRDKKLYNNTLNLLQKIAKENLQIEILNQIAKKNEDKETYDLIIALYAKKIYDSGNVKKSREILKKVIEYPTSDKFRTFVSEIWKRIQRKYQLRIGLLVPLMTNYPDSPFSEVGRDLLSGIQLAVKEFNSNEYLDYEIVLDVKDTERMPSKAVNELKNLIDDEEKLLCVIGPVFSNEAFLCAEIAQKNNVLMITPTATANGISAIGNYIFQANPDYKNRGIALARVAVENFKLVNLAVISPNDPNSRSVVESFVNTATRLGANIVTTEYYEKDTQDLSTQFINLRKISTNLEPIISFSNKVNTLAKMKLVRAGIDNRLLDSLIEVGGSIGINRLLGINGKKIADSLGLVYSFPINYSDSGYYEINSIHGIIFPIISPEEINIIAPQLSYFNINTQIFGTSEWFDENELKKNDKYLNNLIFISEYFVNSEDVNVKNFINNYKRDYDYFPSKHSFYGYDIMNLITHLVRQGYVNSQSLQKALSEVRDFPTLHSKISLCYDRVNTQFNILRYSNGKVQKIGDLK